MAMFTQIPTCINKLMVDDRHYYNIKHIMKTYTKRNKLPREFTWKL